MFFSNTAVGLKRRFLCLLCAFAALSLGIWQAVLLCGYFEPDTLLYAINSPHRTAIYSVITALCVFVVLFIILAIPRSASEPSTCEQCTEAVQEPRAVRYVRLASCAGTAVFTIARVVGTFTSSITFSVYLPTVPILLLAPFAIVVYLCPELISLLCGNDLQKCRTVRSVCGMIGIVWFALDALSSYADTSVPVASEYRKLTILTSLLFMLFLTSEVRQCISAPKPRHQLLFTCLATLVCGPFYIGSLALCISGSIAFGDTLIRTGFGFSFLVYTLTALYKLALSRSKKTEDTSEITANKEAETNG